MSYVEPLLNCDPLEPSSMSPALTTYMPCSPFTSTLIPFFLLQKHLWRATWEKLFPSPARLLQGKAQRWARVKG